MHRFHSVDYNTVGVFCQTQNCLHEHSRNIIDDTVKHRCRRSVENDRSRYREYLVANSGYKAFCLCQDRTHIFLLFSNYRIQSNGNQLFLLKNSSSGLLSNCFYDFFGEIIMTPEINLDSSIFIDTDFLYQFPKFFWAELIQKLNTLGICF